MKYLKACAPPADKDLTEMVMTNYLVFDFETTITENDPSPHVPGNRIVAAGFKDSGGRYRELYAPAASDMDEFATELGQELWPPEVYEHLLYVGQNIKFDLAHAISLLSLQRMPDHRIFIWDTYLADYYMSGQEKVPRNLEALALHYGIPFEKSDYISDAFQLGFGADQVQKDELLQYMREDVQVTEMIYKGQIKKALIKGGPAYVRYLIGLMSASFATSVMNCNGIGINQDRLREYQQTLTEEKEKRLGHCKDFMRDHSWPLNFDINPMSNQQLMASLYGGVELSHFVDETVVEPDTGEPVLYKSGMKKGQVKTRKVKKYFDPSPIIYDLAYKIETDLGVKIDHDVTEKTLLTIEQWCIKHHGPATRLGQLIENVLEVRHICKNLQTYVENMIKYEINGVIHPNFNHAVTATKRLSSSKPNFQNFTNKKDTADHVND